MRKISVGIFVSLYLMSGLCLPTNSEPQGESCSCSSPDGSCSVSVSCRGGCQRYCGSDGNCWAECSGFFTGLRKTDNTPSLRAANRRSGSGTKSGLETSGSKLASNTKKATTVESNARLRTLLLTGQRLSIEVKGTPLTVLIEDLRALTGLDFKKPESKRTLIVNLRLKEGTFKEFVERLSAQVDLKLLNDNEMTQLR